MSDSILDADAVALLRRTKCADFSDDQFAEFLHAVNRFQLDPFGNQIYGRLQMSYGRKQLVIITGIDGYRLIADRSGQYAGSTDAEFDDEAQPRKATVTVAKLVGGTTGYFSASARWDQYYPGDKAGMMWKKMPHLMLAKCAEALALRKAFPAELSGIYTKEEMQQADQDDKMLTGESVKRPIEKPAKRQTLAEAMEEEATLPAGKHDDFAMLSTYIEDAKSETRLDQIVKLAAGFRWSEATATKLADAVEQRRVDLLNLAAQEAQEACANE